MIFPFNIIILGICLSIVGYMAVVQYDNVSTGTEVSTGHYVGAALEPILISRTPVGDNSVAISVCLVRALFEGPMWLVPAFTPTRLIAAAS